MCVSRILLPFSVTRTVALQHPFSVSVGNIRVTYPQLLPLESTRKILITCKKQTMYKNFTRVTNTMLSHISISFCNKLLQQFFQTYSEPFMKSILSPFLHFYVFHLFLSIQQITSECCSQIWKIQLLKILEKHLQKLIITLFCEEITIVGEHPAM